jgi:hypothetical protein
MVAMTVSNLMTSFIRLLFILQANVDHSGDDVTKGFGGGGDGTPCPATASIAPPAHQGSVGQQGRKRDCRATLSNCLKLTKRLISVLN